MKEEYGPDCTVLNTKFSSVTLNELAMDIIISSFNKTAYKKTDINPNVVQTLKTCLEYMGLNIYKFLNSKFSNFAMLCILYYLRHDIEVFSDYSLPLDINVLFL